MKPRVKIKHIITGLDTGGAEMMLFRLLESIDRDQFDNSVISLTTSGPISEKIASLGIPVLALNILPELISIEAFFRMVNVLRQEKPDLVQTWMYHADLIGGLAARMAGIKTVVWGIHNSTLNPEYTKRSLRVIVWTLARISRWLPTRIISCSQRARNFHVFDGYPSEKFEIIPNGFNISGFFRDEKARRETRRQLGVEDDVPLIGMVARFDPQKDHRNFVEAARLLHHRQSEARFLLCGLRADHNNPTLMEWLQQADIEQAFILMGWRTDIPRIINALDVHTLSSISEAFPLTIGEAMACGVPCVGTDVGDIAHLIGCTGVVVPPQDPQALADGWEKLLCMDKKELRKMGDDARQRIEQMFSIQVIARKYEALYDQLLGV
jgi:glycosyltransferase involved in cell wall biosynthesis